MTQKNPIHLFIGIVLVILLVGMWLNRPHSSENHFQQISDPFIAPNPNVTNPEIPASSIHSVKE